MPNAILTDVALTLCACALVYALRRTLDALLLL